MSKTVQTTGAIVLLCRGSLDFAHALYVPTDDATLDRLREVARIAAEIMLKADNFLCIEFTDVSALVLDVADDKHEEIILKVEDAHKADGREYILAPEWFEADSARPGFAGQVRLCLVVDGVFWQVQDKHTDATSETAIVPWEVFGITLGEKQ